MSNELLRIHDENNNCDLVAVANPMGNFHMSTYAEMQDGTQKPVDGWYLFSKMIEKLGQGGGEQPESSMLVATITDDDVECSCDKTFSEIKAAWPNVMIVWNRQTSGTSTNLELKLSDTKISASAVDVVSDDSYGEITELYVNTFDIDSSNQISFNSYYKEF